MRQEPDAVQPEMSPLEYEVWREFIRCRSGLDLPENRRRFLSQRLWERMRVHGARSHSEYYHYVAFNSQGEDEWNELLELLLNHETGFFRHEPSFAALTGHVLPQLMRDRRKLGMNVITMWSAGCATGQEPYSLAMAFLETAAQALSLTGESWQVKVSGSDISPRSLEQARRARYKAYQVRTMPDLYREKYLTVVEDDRSAQAVYHVVDAVRALTQFGTLNLHDPGTYWISAQDVIFCQNVLIYFQPENRIEVVQRLIQRLNPGGYLFLAPAEVVGLKLPNVQPVRLPDSLIYQRKT